MKNIIVKPGEEIALGKRGENLARCAVFDISDWVTTYGEGTVHLLHQRNGDKIPYPCVVETDNGLVCWEITNTETEIAGRGLVELQYWVGDTIAKSTTYNTRVVKSIGVAGDVPPEPAENWLEAMLELGADVQGNAKSAAESAQEAQDAKIAAEEAVGKTSYIGENGNWYEWDGTAGKFVDTGVEARGEDGPAGPAGADGSTPVRGKDYWTAADEKKVAEEAAAAVKDEFDWLPTVDVIVKGGTTFPETSVYFPAGGMVGVNGFDGSNVVPGYDYKVYWRGNEYTSKAFAVDGIVYLGNGSYASVGDNTGEPFLFEITSATSALIMKENTSAGNVTIRVEAPEVAEYDKLPVEFLTPGYAPTIEVSDITGGHKITVTDVEGVKNFNVMDGATGPQGPAGPRGETGATGIQGPAGATGPQGVGIRSVTQTTTSTADDGNNIITVTLTDGTVSTFKVQNGSRGSTGPQGPQGVAGPQGPAGSTGPAGPQGETGAYGNSVLYSTEIQATVEIGFARNLTVANISLAGRDIMVNDMILTADGLLWKVTDIGAVSLDGTVLAYCVSNLRGAADAYGYSVYYSSFVWSYAGTPEVGRTYGLPYDLINLTNRPLSEGDMVLIASGYLFLIAEPNVSGSNVIGRFVGSLLGPAGANGTGIYYSSQVRTVETKIGGTYPINYDSIYLADRLLQKGDLIVTEDGFLWQVDSFDPATVSIRANCVAYAKGSVIHYYDGVPSGGTHFYWNERPPIYSKDMIIDAEGKLYTVARTPFIETGGDNDGKYVVYGDLVTDLKGASGLSIFYSSYVDVYNEIGRTYFFDKSTITSSNRDIAVGDLIITADGFLTVVIDAYATTIVVRSLFYVKGEKGDPGGVKTVNGKTPDENGNVEIEAGGGVSSWNDLTDKPFYEEYGAIMEETAAMELPDPTFGKMWMVMGVPPVKLGKTYDIKYNGTIYTCECMPLPSGLINDPNAVCFGNFAVVGGENTGEPFAIMVSSVYGGVVAIDLVGASAVTIGIYGTIIHPMDTQFLGDDVARVFTVNFTVGSSTDGGWEATVDKTFEEIKAHAKRTNTIVRAHRVGNDGDVDVLPLQYCWSDVAVFSATAIMETKNRNTLTLWVKPDNTAQFYIGG